MIAATLESICKGFGITLSQFFANEEDTVTLDPKQGGLIGPNGAGKTTT